MHVCIFLFIYYWHRILQLHTFVFTYVCMGFNCVCIQLQRKYEAILIEYKKSYLSLHLGTTQLYTHLYVFIHILYNICIR